ncbi:hypothetical protein SAMN05444377_11585 [Flavobacterium fontis]|uniref:WD40-like Beta Propeller Repeat n=1 Tax=Flavobacterium fontis TaxID=1124188 RepID=A0A1M5DLZ7_9FLAO|nr:hypothetical protein [Flavobacterium fontis]SHF68007.1 hypothetical protein SAMN05444377_11585 [Flavobacterium fontis]
MKNFFKSSMYLFAFFVAGILFQISCSNSDSEKNNNAVNSTPIEKIVYCKWGPTQSIWICNYDGSNPTQIPINLPSNLRFNNVNGNANPKLSPDGQTVFFQVLNPTAQSTSIYSCNINGSNLVEVATDFSDQLWIGSAN